jgi:hypothetical protein
MECHFFSDTISSCSSLFVFFPSFINDEALSSELAGYFFLAIGRKDTALQYFLRAHEKYHDWGAVAKCNALFEFVQTTLDSALIATEYVPSSNSNEAIDDKNLRKSKRVH